MSKKQFKSQASSGRVAVGGFNAFGSSSGFGSTRSSPLSYIQEPPDYTSINDANVVVAFKNLSKKDSTTKAKALEDIQLYVGSATEIEDGLLGAWVRLYPRLSIDSARRVRQLAHHLNGLICSKCGKRSARHLPVIAGPWLAGTYDSDRGASKAAQDALGMVFSSSEKVTGLKKTFHGPILEYCRDAILHETVQTLSDERNVSIDDAEATYARVVATSLAVVSSLLDGLVSEDLEKQQHIYEELIGNTTVLNFSSHADAGVRRSTHRLLQTVLREQPSLLENSLKSISTAYIYKALASDQTGSATDYITTLLGLTSKFDSIWTSSYTGKKPAISRLRHMLKRGSYGSTNDFWFKAAELFARLPKDVLPSSQDDSVELLLAARDGVTRKEERFNASAAWPAYFTLVSVISKSSPPESLDELLESCAMPVIRQYLQPSPETADWSISGARPAPLVAQVAALPNVEVLLAREWPRLAENLIEAARASQPQQSKDFQKSQLHVASAGERWAVLQKELYAQESTETLAEAYLDSNVKIVQKCSELLITRQGKPFGAAAIIEELLRTCGQRLLPSEEFKAAIEQLLQTEDHKWVLWESRQQLIRCVLLLQSQPFFEETFKGALSAAMNAQDVPDVGSSTIGLFFTRNTSEQALQTAKQWSQLQNFAYERATPRAGQQERDMILAMYSAGALTDETCDKIFQRIIKSLAEVGVDTGSLRGSLEFLAAMDDSALKRVSSASSGTELLSNLLRLESHEDDLVASEAAALSARLSRAGGDASTGAKFSVVLQNLEHVTIRSLSMDALYDLTDRLLGEEKKVSDARGMLPDLDLWTAALKAATRSPRPSLAILSPLGGAVHLVRPNEGQRKPVQTDGEGLSQALRIAMYVTRLLADTDMKSRLEEVEQKWDILALLYCTALVAEDNLSILGCNALWHPAGGASAESAVLDFVTETNQALNSYWETMKPQKGNADTTGSDSTELLSGLARLHDGSASPLRYYEALANARITSNLYELHGHSAEDARLSEGSLRQTRTSEDIIGTISQLVAQQQPLAATQTMTRFCNELVADLTDLDFASPANGSKALQGLVKLNAILSTQEDAVTTIAKQRLIFLVKRLIPALNSCDSVSIAAEICKTLSHLLPGMSDMYGEHWSEVLAYMTSVWKASTHVDGDHEEEILLAHATLRLYATLRKLASADEPNDDLLDALKDSKDQIYDGLISSLKDESNVSDEQHQPLMITHELLAREIRRLPPRPLEDADELYSLLYAPSHPVQQATFDLLHKHIPSAQEQISLDAALENKTAHLPDELLSLILEAPTLDALVDASFDRTMPLQLQGYLYSWRLLFDHFTMSSYRVKSDYIEQLKDGTYLSGLLSFAFDFLGHTRGKPIDASKFDIEEYVADTEPNPEKDVQWLLTHLYYLALTHLPSLVKTYYLDVRSRQTSLAVESWTAKYISPLIINASLQAVAEWSEKSVKEDPEYEKMSVKVGMRSKEINVSYVVDEQTMAIKVVLPEAYPLASAQVVGVSRVAVKEEKWQSWLRNCQGVITFSNGSITDGLSTWRKNVTGALKGAEECAICYSIIDSQRQLPTKRCNTCKRLFHGNCLYKWFKTSNASTCPLCRQPFNYG